MNVQNGRNSLDIWPEYLRRCITLVQIFELRLILQLLVFEIQLVDQHKLVVDVLIQLQNRILQFRDFNFQLSGRHVRLQYFLDLSLLDRCVLFTFDGHREFLRWLLLKRVEIELEFQRIAEAEFRWLLFLSSCRGNVGNEGDLGDVLWCVVDVVVAEVFLQLLML